MMIYGNNVSHAVGVMGSIALLFAKGKNVGNGGDG